MRRVAIPLLSVLLAAILWALLKPSRTGVIEGVVVDAQGNPVAGARVLVSDGMSPSDSIRDAALAITAANGHFSIPGNPDREWMVTSNSQGRTGTVVATGRTSLEVALHNASIVVTGVVRARDGRPIVGSTLRAYAKGAIGRAPFFTAVTDESGRYELDLDSDAWLVEAVAPGFCASTRAVSVTSEIDFALDAGSRIEGQVTSEASGAPIPFARVLAADFGGHRRGWLNLIVTADGDGRFVFDSLREGEFRLRANGGNEAGWSQTSSVVTPAAPVRDARVLVSPARVVSGRVIDASAKPVVGVLVSLWQEADYEERGQSTATGANGEFELTGVLPWKLHVSVQPGRDSGLVSTSREVDPSARDVTGLEFVLARSATIRGRIADSSGAPAPFVWVGAMERYDTRESPSSASRSNKDGDYVLSGLGNGSVVVEARGRAAGFARSQRFSVSAGNEQRVDLRLEHRPVVSGTLRDERGTVVGGAEVHAGVEATKKLDMSVLATTDSVGRFEFYGLHPGAWWIAATHASGPIGLGLPFGRERRSAVRVELNEEDVTADLVLAATSQTITGVVMSASGPVAGAFVRARSSERYEDDDHLATTASDGRFVLGGLVEGEWELSATAPGFGALDRRSFASLSVRTGSAPITLHLNRPSTISGKVVDESGSPQADFVVEQPFLYARVVVHDSSAAFVLDSLHPTARGPLTIKTASGLAGTLPLTPAMLAEGAVFPPVTVQVDAGLTISGTLLDARTGQPVQLALDISEGGPSARTRSKKDGTFKIEHLPKGRRLHLSVFAISTGSSADAYWIDPDPALTRVDLGSLRPMPGPSGFGEDRANPGVLAVWDSHGSAAIVRKLVAGSAAEVAGIREGDRVVSIDGLHTAGIGDGGVTRLLSGKAGSTVELEVAPRDSLEKPRKLTLTREPASRER